MHENDLADDLLEGAEAIGAFMGWSTRRVFYMAERGKFPIFRVQARLTARKSTLRRHIEELEQAAVS